MSNFTVQVNRAVSQVSREIQLPTTAPTAEVQNTSSSANVTVNTTGPALLEPPSGTVLSPGQSIDGCTPGRWRWHAGIDRHRRRPER